MIHNLPNFYKIDLLFNSSFIFDISLFSLLMIMEYSLSTKIMKVNSHYPNNSSREIMGLALTNILMSCVGLLPLSYGVTSNMISKKFEINNKIVFFLAAMLSYVLIDINLIRERLPISTTMILLTAIMILSNDLLISFKIFT